ncbi:MAG TPA: hypothetical protein VJ385_09285 [Fibrobacteria bacterium]|nr:hypothetical protein [Fibrobacteria bacterium]
MNRPTVTLCAGLSLAFLLLSGCRSRQEASGDKYRKAGDPIHALMQYEEALKRGKLSKEFYKNYTLINIQAMGLRAKEDPTAEFLDVLKDTVASLLVQHPDPTNQALFITTLRNIASARIKMGSPDAVEGGFRFLQAVEKAGGGADATGAAKTEIVNAKLKEIEGDFREASSSPTAGIVADYKLNKLAIMIGGETAEMKDLWSKVRKLNLNTYLMYDNDDVDLGERPDSRINRYGVLLGIVKYEPGSTATKIQVKAWNGTSGPMKYVGDGFTLYDTEGKSYAPSAKIGGFAKTDKDLIPKGEESKTGGLTFNHPAGTVPAYLEFKSNQGLSRKYLP